MNVLLVMSGAASAENWLREAVQRERSRGHTLHPRCAWETQDNPRFAEEAEHLRVERVVLAGGDGTVNQALGALLARGWKGTAGLIPLGTGNDLARSLSLPFEEPESAFPIALHGAGQAMDAARVNDRYFFNVMSVGAGAGVTATAELSKALGSVAYSLKGIASIFSVEPFNASVEWEGGEWKGEMFGLCLGNARFAGGGVPVCPDANLTDGLLDMTLFTGTSLAEGASRLARFLVGGDTDLLVTARSPFFRIRLPQGVPVNVDGEPLQGTEFEIRCVPLAVSIATRGGDEEKR